MASSIFSESAPLGFTTRAKPNDSLDLKTSGQISSQAQQPMQASSSITGILSDTRRSFKVKIGRVEGLLLPCPLPLWSQYSHPGPGLSSSRGDPRLKKIRGCRENLLYCRPAMEEKGSETGRHTVILPKANSGEPTSLIIYYHHEKGSLGLSLPGKNDYQTNIDFGYRAKSSRSPNNYAIWR
jgi:hypothetical protein